MIVVKVRDRDIKAAPMGPVTTGSVGLPVSWHFSEEWDELAKTAVFRVGNDGTEITVAVLEDLCLVPDELLVQDNAGENLWIGVYGWEGEDVGEGNATIAMPTIWTYTRIQDGAQPSGIEPPEGTPGWSEQIQNATNEALRVAHGVRQDADDGKFDGYSPVVTLSEIPHGHRVNITDKEHQEEGQSFDVMDGASAYEQAVAGGYTGTEAEFSEDLAGFSEKAQTAASAAAAAANSASSAEAAKTAAQAAQNEAEYARSDAITAANTAGGYSSQARQAVNQAQSAMNAAQRAGTQAASSATDAASSATAASGSATAAASSATAAADSAAAASGSATAAASSATAAADSAAAAASSATAAGNAQTAAEDAQEAAETAQAAAESARDTAITTLQTEGAAQRTAIQQKGAEVISSIPEDYTDLSDEVDEVKSAISENTANLFDNSSIVIGMNPSGSTGFPKRALSGLITINDGVTIKAYSLGNLRWNVEYYDTTGFSPVAASGWKTTETISTDNAHPYIRILFSRIDDTNLSESDFDNLKLQINYGSAAREWTPHLTAIDYIARRQFVKMRILSYNAGHFNFGQSEQGLVPATADRYIAGMKRMFCTAKPDVLFMQEFTRQLIQNDTNSNSNVTLFYPLFKYATNLIGEWNTIRSCYALNNIKSGYLINKTQFTNAKPYQFAEIEVCGRKIAICCVHFLAVWPSGDTSPYNNIREARAAELQNALALFNDYEYGILAGDFNSTDETGTPEYQAVINTAKQNGFTALNGGYINAESTMLSGNGILDNIFFKGNIMLKDFYIDEDVNNLPSDHKPLIGEIIIY